jgi:hypothetical protein
VGSVGQERERVRHDSNHDLEGHEPDDQRQRDCQIPTVGVRAHAVRVTAGPVLVMTVIVTMLARLMGMRLVIVRHRFTSRSASSSRRTRSEPA